MLWNFVFLLINFFHVSVKLGTIFLILCVFFILQGDEGDTGRYFQYSEGAPKEQAFHRQNHGETRNDNPTMLKRGFRYMSPGFGGE